MARKAGDPRDDDEHWRVLSCQLDQLWIIFRRWRRCLAIPACISVCLPLHLMDYDTMVARISAVGAHTDYHGVKFRSDNPRWLLAHGREEEAVEVISCLEAKPIDDPFVIAQRNEIEFTIRYERDNAVRWRDLLKKNRNDTKTLRRLILGAGSQFMQQMGGINICSYYLPTVLEHAVGLEEKMARLLTACNAISYMIFSGLAVLLVERMGRRGLMLLSTFGQGLCFLIITILYSVELFGN